jgi:hypothetical protein
MLDLLDMRWQLYLDVRDEVMPDPEKAVVFNWSLMRNGIALQIKQEEFIFVKLIADRADIKALKSHWDKVSGKSLKEAAAILAERPSKVRKRI